MMRNYIGKYAALQLLVVHTLLQQFGFLVTNDINLQQLDSHPQLTPQTSIMLTTFLILNLHQTMKIMALYIH